MATNNSNSISFNPQILGDSFRLSDKEDPKVKKLGFDLISLQEEYESSLKQDNDDEAFLQSSNLSLPVMENNLVVIDAVASGDIETLLADLQKLGMQNASSFGSIVSGLFPIESIEQLASLDSLKFAKPAIAITNVGATTSQADAAMNADIARSVFGVDGTGVTVGVLSDSYDYLGGAAADVASGDLPGVGNPRYTKPVKVLQDYLNEDASDEGRAMLQLVHDVAPGAELAFRTAFLGQADFANGILELANVAGSDVIVDDIIYFAEPMFQDGIIAQAVDTVVANGVSYFSAAGNYGRNAYESAFNPSGFRLDGFGEFHDFDPGADVDTLQSITVPQGSRFSISFQWDSPFFSVSGGAGSPNDLDIFVFDSTGRFVLDGSDDPNISGDPLEVFSFFNDGSYGTDQFNIAISNFNGPNPNLMKYVVLGSSTTINEFDTASGTLYGHANANGAQAVGAASYQDTPRFGTNPPILEDFSASGPTPILFKTDGTPTNELRQKPEIVAPDGTNTTFFQSDTDGDGFPNFFGTSAAAPHAAAVAALMLEAAPGTSPADIYTALENTALDMDDPSTPGFDTGFDNASGFGLIQADKVLQQLVGNPNPIFTTDINGTTVEAIDLTGFATDKVTVDYTISREADFNNQIYFYKVDNITGTVGGVAVGESGYLEAALNNLVSPVFSTRDDKTESGSVEIEAGSIVVPLIIADGDLTQALNGTAEVYFSYLGANTNKDNFDHIKLLDSNTFGFEDLPNGGDKDFNDIVIKIDSIV
ncbi:MAG: S8 family serine peptidase [Rivularia sp. T60_A2020_040]|nr:S8 family serine peptidase [Rivularia sp. T60_A2020_040]